MGTRIHPHERRTESKRRRSISSELPRKHYLKGLRDGNLFRGGSAATAVAAELAARTADASSAFERFFMMLLPSDLMVFI
jgi:hypothetical protein